MKQILKITLETVREGQYYLNGIRLDFDLPYSIHIVNNDGYRPYYRVHINGNLTAVVGNIKQAENVLLGLTKTEVQFYGGEKNG